LFFRHFLNLSQVNIYIAMPAYRIQQTSAPCSLGRRQEATIADPPKKTEKNTNVPEEAVLDESMEAEVIETAGVKVNIQLQRFGRNEPRTTLGDDNGSKDPQDKQVTVADAEGANMIFDTLMEAK
jgi:hypothetical protein